MNGKSTRYCSSRLLKKPQKRIQLIVAIACHIERLRADGLPVRAEWRSVSARQ